MQQEPPAPVRSGWGRSLRIVLCSGDTLILTDAELWQGLRHRNSLLFFTAMAGLLMFLDVRGEARLFLRWQNMLFFASMQAAFALCFAGVTLLIRTLRARDCQTRDCQTTVHMTPVLAIASLGMVAASEVLVALVGGRPLDTALGYAILWLLFYVLGEVQAVILGTLLAPGILRDLRSRPAPEPALAPQAPPLLLLGGVRLDPRTICHVRAEGNYVHITTDSGRHHVLGTLATVLAALDPALGRRVHRSHWVAARAVRGFHRTGRDIVLRLLDDTQICVAQSRQKDLLPWLQSVSVRLRPADRAQGAQPD